MAAKHPRSILIVEDNIQFAKILCRHIERHTDHSTEIVSNGIKAVERIRSDDPLLVVLDIGLPDISGFEVCRRVRPQYTGPIIIITGERKDVAQLKGLRSGADDYIIKPVNLDIAVARIDNLIKRLSVDASNKDHTSGIYHLSDLNPVRAGDLTIDPINQTVQGKSGKKLSLSPSEAYLLWLLASKQGEPVSRDELCQVINGNRWDGKSRLPDVFVSKLRKKIGKLSSSPIVIKSVRAAGYVLVVLMQ